MPDKQLLHLVIGGELKDVDGIEFSDLKKVELVGAYPNYAEAFRAWKAHARYFILHAHKLIEPGPDDDGHEH